MLESSKFASLWPPNKLRCNFFIFLFFIFITAQFAFKNELIIGRMNKESATQTVAVRSISDLVKPKTTKIGIRTASLHLTFSKRISVKPPCVWYREQTGGQMAA